MNRRKFIVSAAGAGGAFALPNLLSQNCYNPNTKGIQPAGACGGEGPGITTGLISATSVRNYTRPMCTPVDAAILHQLTPTQIGVVEDNWVRLIGYYHGIGADVSMQRDLNNKVADGTVTGAISLAAATLLVTEARNLGSRQLTAALAQSLLTLTAAQVQEGLSYINSAGLYQVWNEAKASMDRAKTGAAQECNRYRAVMIGVGLTGGMWGLVGAYVGAAICPICAPVGATLMFAYLLMNAFNPC